MNKSSKRNQNNLLGEFGYKILEEVSKGENIAVYSSKGMGLNTIVKEVTKEFIALNPRHRIVNIYPHESYLVDYREIEKLLLEKYRFENESATKETHSIHSLVKEIQKFDLRLVVIMHKVQDFRNFPEFESYFLSLSKASNNVSVLISGTLSKYYSQESTENTSYNNYIFAGFVGKGLETILKRIQRQIGHLKNISSVQVSSKVYGHTGLIKAIVKNNLEDKDIEELIINEDIRRRLVEIEKELESVGIKCDQIGSPINTKILEKIGLMKDGELLPLLQQFIEKNILKDIKITNELTSTEEQLFNILQNNNSEYLTVGELISSLGETKFDTQSDWALYKHINNLKKKLKKHGMTIESKRSKGYKLTSLKDLSG